MQGRASHALRDNISRLDCLFFRGIALEFLSLEFGTPHTLRSLSLDLGGHSIARKPYISDLNAQILHGLLSG